MLPPSRTIPALIALILGSYTAYGRAQTNLIDRVLRSEKSIVTVRTELTKVMHNDPTKSLTYYRTAAGLVLDPSGIIVVNTHTIIHAPYIFIILQDGTKLPAELLYATSEFDFSFLRVHPPHPLTPIPWADSSLVNVGDTVIAVGNSDYDNQSIMSGHIKSILQSNSSGENDFFELDLDLYHGDSGGPILDEQGRLLGMVMAKRESEENSSIAIASDKIREKYLEYK